MTDRRTPTGLVRYAWALFAVVVAILARWFADPRLGPDQLPYGSVLVATVCVAWILGIRPALLVVAIGGPAANFFLLPPRLSFSLGAQHQSWGLVVFLFLGSVVSVVGGYAHLQRTRAEAAADDKQRRADELRRKAEELEVANRRMQEAAHMQSEFLANMSHELRTPLNAIIGFAEIMHGGVAGPIADEHREFLGDILASSRHLLQLIEGVLDLSKAQSGALEISPQEVELARLIVETRDIVRDQAARRAIAVELEVPDDLGRATVDVGKLRQILYNYVSNALKFTHEGGRVVIRAAARGDAFRIEVQDTGIGIANEHLPFLFVAFRQLDAGATKRYQGTGLGLALTKRLAEAHGGTVGVHSVRGAGSTFWVELPRVAVGPHPKPG